MEMLVLCVISLHIVPMQVTQTEPMDIAAHLSVMSDALTTIGKELANNVSYNTSFLIGQFSAAPLFIG